MNVVENLTAVEVSNKTIFWQSPY